MSLPVSELTSRPPLPTLQAKMLGLPGLPSFSPPPLPTLQASDISKMLGVLGLPSFSLLSKNNYQLGYLLDRIAVR